jgi:hypothetical protein
MTLQALRLRVRDPVFFRILRSYAAEYRFGNATTADFVAEAEKVSGQDLSALFTTWLYSPGSFNIRGQRRTLIPAAPEPPPNRHPARPPDKPAPPPSPRHRSSQGLLPHAHQDPVSMSAGAAEKCQESPVGVGVWPEVQSAKPKRSRTVHGGCQRPS